MLRIAINGFGRIGRLFLRALLENPHPNISVVAVHDTASPEICAHLFKYDSVHGVLPNTITLESDEHPHLIISPWSHPIAIIPYTHLRQNLPWKQHAIDIVVECSGRNLKPQELHEHFMAGATKILVAAPVTGAEFTVIYGLNHEKLSSSHRLVSNASCTTNCMAHVVASLSDIPGITKGQMTTLHAYTADQQLVDRPHSDFQRARAATLSMIPTHTGVTEALIQIFPHLGPRIHCRAVRVPVPNVSMIDFSFLSTHPTSIDQIRNQIIAYHQNANPIVALTTLPLVSCDFNHRHESAIFDLTQIDVVDQNLCRVTAWYDNEFAYAMRLRDTLAFWSSKITSTHSCSSR